MSLNRMEQTGTGALGGASESSDEFLTTLRPHVEVKRVAAGAVLFVEGESGDCAYVVSQGTVQILKEEDACPVSLAVRGPGDIIGEMALIDDSPRFASAVCTMDCELFVLSRARFFEMLGARSEIAEKVLRMMTARVREADVKRLQELEAANVDLQLARIRLEDALVHRDRILSVSPYPIVVTNADDQITLMNPAARELLGDSGPATLWKRIVPRDPTVPAQASERLTNDEAWRAEIEADGPNARGLICRIVSVPVPDSGGGPSARLWIIEDVTEVRTLQKQAVEQYGLTMKGEVAGEIAHEINNYLTILSGNVELMPLRLKSKDPMAVDRTLENIRQAITRMTVFTDNLLRSRHPLGQRTRINLNEFLSNQIAFLGPQKRFKKLTIRTEFPNCVPELECDPSGLQQVIYNLLLNAADALNEARSADPTVIISTHCDVSGSKVYLTVADNGPGISEDVRPHLFQERITSKPTGHGFGTLTVLRIVQEHGGSITVSERAGGGAQFVIALPINSTASNKE